MPRSSGMPLPSPLMALAAAALLFGCALQARAAAPDGIVSAYVVLGEQGRPYARVLTADARCPVIRFDAQAVPMSVRAASADSRPALFPLLACEREIPAGTRSALVNGRLLPLPKREIRRIVVIGDSGCRLNKSERAYQACNDAARYPFARIAAAAAAWRPDLVVHVGDLLYRENACPPGNQACSGSPWGYGWDAWQADFFGPAAALLRAAPWVMVRGNHESCARAGQGWWRMLAPFPLLPGRGCNSADDDHRGDYSDPYAVPLGGDAQLIVLDTSNASNDPIPPDDLRSTRYRADYRRLGLLSQQASYNIVATHHPLLGFGVEPDRNGTPELQPGNRGLQSVFAAINPLLMPPRVDVLLSGHVHMWQQLSFSSPHPSQFVAGFSGTMEDLLAVPARLPPGATPAPGAVVERHSSWNGGFGYMTMERTGAISWRAGVWDSDGREIETCSISGRHSRCSGAHAE